MRKLIATLLFILWPGLIMASAQRAVFFNMNVQPAPSGACTDGPTTNMVLRMDATSLTSCSGGAVSSWVSGFGTNTLTGVNSPTCVASVFGSVPGVLLSSGSSQYFTMANTISASSSNTITIMVAWKPVATSVKQTIISGINNNAFAYGIVETGTPVQGADSSNAVGLGSGTATSTAGNIYQTNVTYNNIAAPSFRHNKLADPTASGATATISNPISILGSNFNNGSPNEFTNSYIGAVYIFTPHLTTTDIQTWENTLSCKYPGT
jgi:hypothetical protein